MMVLLPVVVLVWWLSWDGTYRLDTGRRRMEVFFGTEGDHILEAHILTVLGIYHSLSHFLIVKANTVVFKRKIKYFLNAPNSRMYFTILFKFRYFVAQITLQPHLASLVRDTLSETFF